MTQVQLSRGAKVSPSELTGITANTVSNPQYCKGHNAIIVNFVITAGSGTWTIALKNKISATLNTAMYDVNGNAMELTGVTGNRSQVFVGIPEDFVIDCAETGDGATVNVSYELFTV